MRASSQDELISEIGLDKFEHHFENILKLPPATAISGFSATRMRALQCYQLGSTPQARTQVSNGIRMAI